jgi:hypothetical protein
MAEPLGRNTRARFLSSEVGLLPFDTSLFVPSPVRFPHDLVWEERVSSSLTRSCWAVFKAPRPCSVALCACEDDTNFFLVDEMSRFAQSGFLSAQSDFLEEVSVAH